MDSLEACRCRFRLVCTWLTSVGDVGDNVRRAAAAAAADVKGLGWLCITANAAATAFEQALE
jgi:hypothetical protein